MGLKVNLMDVLIAGTCLGHAISRIATRDKDFKVISKVDELFVMNDIKNDVSRTIIRTLSVLTLSLLY